MNRESGIVKGKNKASGGRRQEDLNTRRQEDLNTRRQATGGRHQEDLNTRRQATGGRRQENLEPTLLTTGDAGEGKQRKAIFGRGKSQGQD